MFQQVMNWMRDNKILPQISDTERQALEAGDVWIDGQFFGGKVDQAIKDKARVELQAGVATLARHGRFAPYVAGSEMTIADLLFLYSFDLACTVAQKLFDLDLKAELPQGVALLEEHGAMEHTIVVAANASDLLGGEKVVLDEFLQSERYATFRRKPTAATAPGN